MGNPKANDGSILRSDLDGGNLTTIVPPGGTFTPKQLQIEKTNGKLYWSDREGMRVMRANLDGSASRPSSTPARAILARAAIQQNGAWASPSMPMAARSTGRRRAATTRAKVASCAPESTFRGSRRRPTAWISNCSTTSLPEPIDLDFDLGNRMLYWTDRGDPPRGNTVNRAPLDAPQASARSPRSSFAT